ncbi:phosphatase PAP2 family protein [Piscirickettsia litoralis]|uniref:phosphatase PAP2 family protein n=1 Tax=Piscirickettsia litoralis TaxID=1891921 RepID=UPI001300DD17|nr:phosphatase PAP2 family protein [Piscirickettsia litoralis]
MEDPRYSESAETWSQWCSRISKSDTFAYVMNGSTAWMINEGIKRFYLQERPNGQDSKAWPSGHSGWGAMLMGLAMMLNDDKELKVCGKTLTISKSGVFAVGFIDALVTMVGRVIAKKHWLGDTLSGAALSASLSMITGNLLAWRRGKDSSADATYTKEMVIQALGALAVLVSNPLIGSIPLQLSLEVISQVSEWYSKGTVYGNKVDSFSDLALAITKGMALANLTNYKDMTPAEVSAAVFKLVTVYGGIAANIFDLPFTARSGWNTSIEREIYRGHEQLAQGVERATWITAVGGAAAGLMVAALKSVSSSGATMFYDAEKRSEAVRDRVVPHEITVDMATP